MSRVGVRSATVTVMGPVYAADDAGVEQRGHCDEVDSQTIWSGGVQGLLPRPVDAVDVGVEQRGERRLGWAQRGALGACISGNKPL